jgi:hypothetical protein
MMDLYLSSYFGFIGYFMNDFYHSFVSFIFAVHPTFWFCLVRRVAITFVLVEFSSYVLLMARSDRSDITINTALAGTSGSNNRRKKTNAQKKAKRHYARWLMAYVATYGLEIGENYGFHEFMEVADLILNQEADYQDPQKRLSELHELTRIAQQEKHNWPYDIEEHPLTEVFNKFFD